MELSIELSAARQEIDAAFKTNEKTSAELVSSQDELSAAKSENKKLRNTVRNHSTTVLELQSASHNALVKSEVILLETKKHLHNLSAQVKVTQDEKTMAKLEAEKAAKMVECAHATEIKILYAKASDAECAHATEIKILHAKASDAAKMVECAHATEIKILHAKASDAEDLSKSAMSEIEERLSNSLRKVADVNSEMTAVKSRATEAIQELDITKIELANVRARTKELEDAARVAQTTQVEMVKILMSEIEERLRNALKEAADVNSEMTAVKLGAAEATKELNISKIELGNARVKNKELEDAAARHWQFSAKELNTTKIALVEARAKTKELEDAAHGNWQFTDVLNCTSPTNRKGFS